MTESKRDVRKARVYGLYFHDHLLFIGQTRLPIMSMMKYHRSNVRNMDSSKVNSKRALYCFMRKVGCENIEPRVFDELGQPEGDLAFYVYRLKRVKCPSIPTDIVFDSDGKVVL